MTAVGDRVAEMRTTVNRVLHTVPWLGARVALRLHRSGLGADHLTWDELAELVELSPPTVLSVDVFDTCVVRDLLGDPAIEVAIDRQLEREGIVARPSDVDATGPGADAERAAVAKRRVEVAATMEARLCRVVPGVVDALARVRAAGVAVTFLSDTERSSESLREMLRALGILVEGDELIASSEAGATKSDGDLFTETWTDGPPRAGVWHVGNNYWSDITMAEQAGLRPIPIVAAEPTRYEEAMAARPATAGPAIAGAARRVRLEIAAGAEDELGAGDRLEILGVEVAGQVFSAFLLWVSAVARAEGIGHLSFLSRDGELPYVMAQSMPADHWPDMSLGYIHCSRWSWLLAGAASYGVDEWLAAGTADDQAFIHANRHRVPLGSLLGRIGLDLDDVAAHHDLAALDPSVPLPGDHVDAWVALLADPLIAEVIDERAHERAGLIRRYLVDAGMPAERVGLVDVGWRGRLAWGMSPIVAEVTGADPIHLHFGGDKVLPDAEATIDIRRFAFDGIGQPDPILNPVSCVETLTASGRARVVGYQPSGDGSVEPVFQREVTEVANADRRRLWSGAERAAAAMPSRATLDELGCDAASLGPESIEVLAQWWNHPAREEAEAMQGLSFETDDDGRAVRPLLNPYSARELATEQKSPRQWQQGSAAVTPRPLGPALAVVRKGIARLQRRRS